MISVSSKEGFQRALENKEPQILVTGELATSMRNRAKLKKSSKVGAAALIIGGIVSIPFTAGASAALTAMGLSATALTAGIITVSYAELAVLCGFVIGLTGILKGANVEFASDGTVIVTPKYK